MPPRSLLSVILAITLVFTASAAERESLKLLTIGNSFSNDALDFLPGLAKTGGKSLIVGRASIGGCSLERHARHLKQAESGDPQGKAYKTNHPKTGVSGDYTLPELLAAQPWDIVTIQQWSQLSFKPETFQPFADELIAAIHKYAPTAEIVVHETWAYREDHEWFKKDDGFTPAKMYAGISATYKAFADSKGLRVLPVGDAFNLARQTPRWTYVTDANFDFKNPPAGQLPDQRTSLNAGWRWSTPKAGAEPKFTLDAIHCNAAGKYLGASVWYLQLFGANDVPASFVPKGLTAEDTADLRTHILAAVKAERSREKPAATPATAAAGK